MMNCHFLRPTFALAISLVLLGNASGADQSKQRVFVLTDISNEPDDEESMVRFLVYSNEYDVEVITLGMGRKCPV